MNYSEIITEVRSAMKSGKIFNVTFVKKDGTIRNMTARMGVKKHHVNSPGIPATTAEIPKYLTVYDFINKGYRNVNTDAILNFKCGIVMANLPAPIQEEVIKQGTPAECDVDINNINFLELM